MNFVRDDALAAFRRDEGLRRCHGTGGEPAFGSALPGDAVARIWRAAPSPLSSGRAGEGRWKLRFERRSPPFVEPLMGWTGGTDALDQVELSFPTREAAIAYAESQGVAYRVERVAERSDRRCEPKLEAQLQQALASLASLYWMQARYGRCDGAADPDLEPAAPEGSRAEADERASALLFVPGFGRTGAAV